MNFMECLYKPVILFKNNGEIFKMKGIKGGLQTKYFFIKEVTNSCITVLHLRTCNLCNNDLSLSFTCDYITLNKESFCGYHVLDNVCVQKCSHKLSCMKDCISGKFTILPKKEVIIWKSNMEERQLGTLKLIFKDEVASVKVNVYKGNRVTQYFSNYIQLDYCNKISLETDGKSKVTGEYMIKMISMIEC